MRRLQVEVTFGADTKSVKLTLSGAETDSVDTMVFDVSDVVHQFCGYASPLSVVGELFTTTRLAWANDGKPLEPYTATADVPFGDLAMEWLLTNMPQLLDCMVQPA